MTAEREDNAQSPMLPPSTGDQSSGAEPMLSGAATPAQVLAAVATLRPLRWSRDRTVAEQWWPQFAMLLPALERLLSDPEPTTVAGAVAALYHTLERPESLAVLAPRLGLPGVLDALWNCLRGEGHGGAPRWADGLVPPLVERLTHGSEPEQRRALECLHRFYGPVLEPAVPRLVELLASPDEGYRHSAATMLGYVSEAEFLRPWGPQLVAALPRDEDGWVRSSLLAAIGRLGPSALSLAEPALNRLLADGELNPGVRRAVATAFLGLGVPEHALQMWKADLLSETESHSREEAARALSNGGEAGRAVLRSLLSAPSANARRIALAYLIEADLAGLWDTAVAELRSSADAGWPVELLNKLWSRAGRADDPIGAERRIELLLELTSSDDAELRRAASNFLMVQQTGAAGVSLLIAALSQPQPKIQLCVARKLARLGPTAQAAVPALQAMAASPDRALRAAARNALAQIAPDELPLGGA